MIGCDALHEVGLLVTLGDAKHVTIRPYRPQTNGKVERFFRTLKDEWLYSVNYTSEHDRITALTYLTTYLHHLPSLLQPPPTPQRHHQPTTHHPLHQPPRYAQVGASACGARNSGRASGRQPVSAESDSGVPQGIPLPPHGAPLDVRTCIEDCSLGSEH